MSSRYDPIQQVDVIVEKSQTMVIARQFHTLISVLALGRNESTAEIKAVSERCFLGNASLNG